METADNRAAGIVLAGGRSARMGSAKADLDWHGQPLLARVCGLLERADLEPIVVVKASAQELPAVDVRFEVVADRSDGQGPLEGLRTGLEAVAGRAPVAFVAATDAPFLHPAVVRCVVHAVGGHAAVAVPESDGRLHPLAGAYRTSLWPVAASLRDHGERRLGALLDAAPVAVLDRATLLADPAVAAADPALCSLTNLNDRASYLAALGEQGPAVSVRHAGGPPRTVRAWTLTAAAHAVGAVRATSAEAAMLLNGEPVPAGMEIPLLTGDVVEVAGSS